MNNDATNTTWTVTEDEAHSPDGRFLAYLLGGKWSVRDTSAPRGSAQEWSEPLADMDAVKGWAEKRASEGRAS